MDEYILKLSFILLSAVYHEIKNRLDELIRFQTYEIGHYLNVQLYIKPFDLHVRSKVQSLSRVIVHTLT
jgi:hypothetical protein